jgi:REP element-mobilizing transposase RayT
MSHTHTCLNYHVVFGTKGRAQSIRPEVRLDLCRYLGGILKSEGALPLEINAVADHVHLLVRLPPTILLADLLRALKANSSKWLNDTRFSRRTFAWQQGYSAFTVSQSQVARVAAYVRNQEAHHRKMTFREELIALFERNGVQYDERYLPRP